MAPQLLLQSRFWNQEGLTLVSVVLVVSSQAIQNEVQIYYTTIFIMIVISSIIPIRAATVA